MKPVDSVVSIRTLWLTVTSLVVGGATASSQQPHVLAFSGVTVIDVTDGRLLPEQAVVVIGNAIQAVGPVGQVRVPRGAQVVDARGKYLIPGLWDMHAHPLDYSDVFYPLAIANGVTGIREPGTPVPLDTVRQWRRDIAAGIRIGPRAVVSGPSLDMVAGSAMQFRPVTRSPNIRVATADQARHLVDSLRAAGADFIKVHEVGREVYFAIAAEARRLGIPFGGHIPGGGSALLAGKALLSSMTAIEASDSGANLLDHGHGMHGACMGDSANLEACRVVAERLRRNGTWVVPTLVVQGGRIRGDLGNYAMRYWPDSVFPGRKGPRTAPRPPLDSITAPVPANLRLDLMQQLGVPLLAGTDAGPTFPSWGLAPGFSLHEELVAMVWAGVTPLTALQAATLNPAKFLRATDTLGTIAPGKRADLVLLDANPLADIYNTTKIRAVIANGRYFDRTALDALLVEVERKARTP